MTGRQFPRYGGGMAGGSLVCRRQEPSPLNEGRNLIERMYLNGRMFTSGSAGRP